MICFFFQIFGTQQNLSLFYDPHYADDFCEGRALLCAIGLNETPIDPNFLKIVDDLEQKRNTAMSSCKTLLSNATPKTSAKNVLDLYNSLKDVISRNCPNFNKTWEKFLKQDDYNKTMIALKETLEDRIDAEKRLGSQIDITYMTLYKYVIDETKYTNADKLIKQIRSAKSLPNSNDIFLREKEENLLQTSRENPLKKEILSGLVTYCVPLLPILILVRESNDQNLLNATSEAYIFNEQLRPTSRYIPILEIYTTSNTELIPIKKSIKRDIANFIKMTIENENQLLHSPTQSHWTILDTNRGLINSINPKIVTLRPPVSNCCIS